MAFPTTPVIDPFTGAGPTAPPPNWLLRGTRALRLLAGQVDSNVATQSGSGIWAPGGVAAVLGPDMEAYVTVAVLPTTIGDAIDLLVRSRDADPVGVTQYRLRITLLAGGSYDWALSYVVNGGTLVTLTPTVTQAIAAGEKVGLEAIGNNVRAMLFTGGAWTQVFTRADTHVPGTGTIGLTAFRQVMKLDDFGGGTVVTAAPGAELAMVV